MDNFAIDGRQIGPEYKPYIIAEMSGNHNQSLDRALKIIDAIVESGADAVKLQTYKPETMTLDLKEGDFYISDKENLWYGKSLYDLYAIASTPWEWTAQLFEYCKKKNITIFSTPFDETAVDFLEQFDPPCYKIASFENVHLPLIKRAAQTGKPLIISTGLTTLADIELAVKTARNAGCKELMLMHCNSGYPSLIEEANIRTINHMQQMFNCPVGYSDHTPGIGAAVASVALGAVAIEKHVTLKREEKTVDVDFSLTPQELKLLVDETKRAHTALGKVSYGVLKQEEGSRIFKRSLYITKDIKAGEQLTQDNVAIVRPGFGLHAKHYTDVLGRSVSKDVKRGTRMSWQMLA